MEHACVNPYCSCQDCDGGHRARAGSSSRPLHRGGVGRRNQELRYTVTSRYRHATSASARPEPGRRRRAGGHEQGITQAARTNGGEITIGDPEELLDESLRDERRQAAVLASFADVGVDRAAGGHASVRTAEHNGHTIEIRTTYDVRIDGEPDAHISVSDDGNVHYHGLPNYAEASAST